MRGCFPGADFGLSQTLLLHHMVLSVERKMKRLDVICRKKKKKMHQSFLTGDFGGEHRAGRRQEEEEEGDRQLHGSSWSDRALLQPPLTLGCSAGEDHCAHTESAPRLPSVVLNTRRREKKTHPSSLLRCHTEQGAGVKVRVAGVRVLWRRAAERLSGGGGGGGGGRRKEEGEEEGGRDARVGLSSEAGEFHYFNLIFSCRLITFRFSMDGHCDICAFSKTPRGAFNSQCSQLEMSFVSFLIELGCSEIQQTLTHSQQRAGCPPVTEDRCWEFICASQSKRRIDVRVSVAAPPLEGADGNSNHAHHVIRDYMTSTGLFLMRVEA